MIRTLAVAILVLLTCGIGLVHSANILIVIGMGSPSHKLPFLTYAEALLGLRHDVTIISPFPTKGAKFRDITPKLLLDVMAPLMNRSFVDIRLNNDWWLYWTSFGGFSFDSCQAIIRSPEVEDYINGKEMLDLIIVDPLASECAFGFSYVHKAPVIYFNTAGIYPWSAGAFGLPSLAVYHPTNAVMYNKDISKFTHRLVAALGMLAFEYQRHLRTFPAIEKLWKQRLGGPMPSFAEMERNVSLMLLNTHPLVDEPVPYTSNIITIGGIHIPSLKGLPKDLEDFVTGSGNDGFILFSLGSIVRSKTLPSKYYDYFIKAFKKLPQRVVWNWESDNQRDDMPPNVLAKNWLPQHDLLAHPKCRGFVTHGGKLSLLEATEAGVPVVLIPFFADQDLHSHVVVRRGFGLTLDLHEVTADNLYQAIITIVNEPRFREKAAHRAKMFRDEPDTPLYRALFWTQYVLRHPEGPDMRPVAATFTWYQYHMVDVWVFVAFVALLPLVALYFILGCLMRLVRRHVSQKNENKIKRS